MKVILKQDVQGSGKSGDIVNVSDGYAKNFLLKRGLAVEATDRAMKEIKAQKAAEEKRRQEEIEAAKAAANEIDGKTIKVFAKAGAGGKLFGSVTSKEIADELKKQLGFDADKRKISIEGEVKAFGTYKTEIKLHHGVSAAVFVMVGEEQ